MIVKECVSEAVNVIPSRLFAGVAEIKREVTLDMLSNVAVSDAVVPGEPVVGDQFPLVFQSVEPDEFHVPLSAKMALCIETKSKVAVARSNDVCGFLEKLKLVFMLILHWRTPAPKTVLGVDAGKFHARMSTINCRVTAYDSDCPLTADETAQSHRGRECVSGEAARACVQWAKNKECATFISTIQHPNLE